MSASPTKEIQAKALAAAEAIYRLTSISSFDAALKLELRTRAIAIVSYAASFSVVAASGARNEVRSAEEHRIAIAAALEAIQALVRFASSVHLMSAANTDRVLGAYRRIRECMDGIVSGHYDAGGAVSSPFGELPPIRLGTGGARPSGSDESTAAILNERQRRIVGYLGSAGQAQISDIRGVFGTECSEKTLQRDLWQLVRSGLIQRRGDNRWTTYMAT